MPAACGCLWSASLSDTSVVLYSSYALFIGPYWHIASEALYVGEEQDRCGTQSLHIFYFSELLDCFCLPLLPCSTLLSHSHSHPRSLLLISALMNPREIDYQSCSCSRAGRRHVAAPEFGTKSSWHAVFPWAFSVTITYIYIDTWACG